MRAAEEERRRRMLIQQSEANVRAAAGSFTRVPPELLVRSTAAAPGTHAAIMDRSGHAASGSSSSSRPTAVYGSIVLAPVAVKTYLENGGDPNAVPTYLYDAYSTCCEAGYMGGPDEVCAFNVFCAPCNMCNVVTNVWLCPSVANANKERLTLLHMCVMLGAWNSAQLLLAAGANPLICSAKGETPIAMGTRLALEHVNMLAYPPKVHRVQSIIEAAVEAIVSAHYEKQARAREESHRQEEERKFAALAEQQSRLVKEAVSEATANAPGVGNRAPKIQKKGKYAFFLSHVKSEAGVIAALLFQVLTFEFGLTQQDVFLDTERLTDLRTLKQEVLGSDTVVILLTKTYLTRPWCLIEVYEAVKAGLDIKPVLVEGLGYDFAQASALLSNPDVRASLDAVNPGAFDSLVNEGYDPAEMFATIAQTLPYLLARPFNPNASLAVKRAQIVDVFGAGT